MKHRIHNFCAGPCTLPLTVLEEAQAEITDFQGSGMSVMEISHRSRLFEDIHEEALALAQELIGAPKEFFPLFLPGGAHQQFSMTALNLLTKEDSAAVINSGIWATKAMEEANRIATMNEAWSGKSQGFTTLPAACELNINANARYLHITSNETIGGIQFHQFPKVDIPLVIDASSDYFSREIPWDGCDIVYGGAQKNLAPAGISVTFVRKSLLKAHPHIPQFLTYKAHADANSLYNTPPTWQIYILGKVLKWMKKQGGVAYFHQYSIEKSNILYDFIDNNPFYHNPIAPPFRSRTNVIFRTPSDALDTLFWQSAEKAGFNGLKGHRIVGGLRASLYNALNKDSVIALTEYMADFAEKNS